MSQSCILSMNSALPVNFTCLEQLTCNWFATLCIGQGTSLKVLPGFDGPAKGDSLRLGSRIQEEPKSCSLPYRKKTNFSNLRDLTKVEDMLLFWDLPLLFV